MENRTYRNSLVAVLAGFLLAPVSLLYAGTAGRPATLNLYPAQGMLGARVISADGHAIGEISNFVFDFHGQPRLTDVMVTPGLFGSARAVPIGAIRQKGDCCRVDLSKKAFASVPSLPDDVSAFFANRRNVENLDRDYHLPARRPGGRYVTYSSLQHEEVVGRADADIGFLTDALVNINDGRVLYLAVVPTAPIFDYQTALRLEIPAADVTRDHAGVIHLDTPFGRSLIDARSGSELKGFSSSMTPEGEVFHLKAAA